MPLPRFIRGFLAVSVVLVAACADHEHPAAPDAVLPPEAPRTAVQMLDCEIGVASGILSCGRPAASSANRRLIGGQNENVKLTSFNFASVPGTMVFDVTVQNLLPEQIGTPDGEVVDTAGVSVFFFSGPTVTVGTGNVWVDNEDGERVFTGTVPQPYFRYNQKLASNEVSAAKTWRIAYDSGAVNIAFKVYVAAEVQPLLVINELLVNPGGAITDASGEWFEVHNAGHFPVEMQGMVIADSSVAGRRPYHVISSSLTVPSGGYVVFGATADTTVNGGVPVDYAYGTALTLANSLDAVKIGRVYVADTLTIDRARYASAAISAKNGISRELVNPTLDNSDVDGASWSDAVPIFGAGGSGTPRAQNSTFTP